MQAHLPDDDPLMDDLARHSSLVSDAMRRVLDAQSEPREFYGMMRYHLGWVDERLRPIAAPGGKGLRASLLLLVNAALGGDEATAVPLAAAIELLHNFSLVHDDIEDGGTMRRHRAALWSIWGAPLGINAGDGLFSIAHLALFGSSLRQSEPGRFIEVLHRFEHTVLHLCEGQHMDMTFEGMTEVSVDEYVRMIAGKSAALIASAAWIGARAVPTADDDTAEVAGRFGQELGLAFQMQDDILGIWGDEAVTGKSTVSDIASRKKTLPVLLAMAHARGRARERLRELYSRRGDGEVAECEILTILDGTDARVRANEYLQRHVDAAMQALDDLRLPPVAEQRLRRFAGLFVNRSA